MGYDFPTKQLNAFIDFCGLMRCGITNIMASLLVFLLISLSFMFTCVIPSLLSPSNACQAKHNISLNHNNPPAPTGPSNLY